MLLKQAAIQNAFKCGRIFGFLDAQDDLFTPYNLINFENEPFAIEFFRDTDGTPGGGFILTWNIKSLPINRSVAIITLWDEAFSIEFPP